ncbi:ribonuclease H-like protein [Polyplosphaeria fusca]|uniref:ribonuclease H n=1 Tax=Polyplosphaeria fusca TaxID=682080 RepID=A0A9P4QNU4_9PLEO|nr:ribonuclease H-like protein [Polyplosphaeria fusca]
MPLGWYLAQGLYPLGYDSSDDDEGPCQLPDGRWVCGPHGLAVCGRCCSDYTFMGDNSHDEDDEDDAISADADMKDADMEDKDEEEEEEQYPVSSSGLEKRKGTGRVFPAKFSPPNTSITPTELFSRLRTFGGTFVRYTHRNDMRKLLLFTDGACLNNGQPNPQAGWAFVHGPVTSINAEAATVFGRLEAEGPFGDASPQTSNRAELRAVIAALRFRHWTGEDYRTIVIATDSEYVVEGATTWAKKWIKNNWLTSGHQPVKNADLWKMLLGEVERWSDEGLAIEFWKIPRQWNTIADGAAKKAAAESGVSKHWREYMGVIGTDKAVVL